MKKNILILSVILIICLITACGNKKSDTVGEKIEWPDTEIGNMLPDTDNKALNHSISENYISASLVMNKDEYKDYCEQCKNSGFTENASTTDNETYSHYSADNTDGYALSLSWYSDDNKCQLMLSAPNKSEDESTTIEDEESETEKSEEQKEDKAKKKKEKKKKDVDSNGVSKDFKETMDDYEEFFDKYIEIMENYSDNPAEYLQQYTEYLSKYTEVMKELDAIDEDTLTDADRAYYFEVMARINTKLANAAA